jgi:methionyl-tRNA formyltransferase
VYQPKSLRPEESAAPLREWQAELIVVAAFGQILRSHVLDLPPKGCLNVHASLLPRWRGASPIQHAILAGDKETGVTLMRMDEGMDTGPICVQEAIPIEPREMASTLHDRLSELGAQMLTKYLPDILAGRLQAVAQDESRVTYAPLIKKEDGAIDWRQSSLYIDRQIRAMTPWPGAFTIWQGQRLKVLSAEPIAGGAWPTGAPGQVVTRDDGAAVLTGEDALELKVVQLAGKRATDIDDFLRGRPEFIGSRLGS